MNGVRMAEGRLPKKTNAMKQPGRRKKAEREMGGLRKEGCVLEVS